jgi:hypothetical protein
VDRNTFELLEKPESLKADEAIMKLWADPERLAELEIKRQAQLAAMKPEERAALQGEITPWITEQVEVSRHLEVVQRELTARRTHDLSRGHKRSKRNPMIEKRRDIIQAHAQEGFHAPDICEELDLAHIDLPQGPDWEKYRQHRQPWTAAYRRGGKELQGRILTIFSKDKKP